MNVDTAEADRLPGKKEVIAVRESQEFLEKAPLHKRKDLSYVRSTFESMNYVYRSTH